jgi:hypothetical protein
MIIIQPSASRTTNPCAPIPSSKLLGYYHSSALRTENSTFRAKPHQPSSEVVFTSDTAGLLNIFFDENRH